MHKRMFLPCAPARNRHRVAEIRDAVKSSLKRCEAADRRSIMNVGRVWRLPETRRGVSEKSYYVNGLGRLRMQVKGVAAERQRWAHYNTFTVNTARGRPGAEARNENPFPSQAGRQKVQRGVTGAMRKSAMAMPRTSRLGAAIPPI